MSRIFDRIYELHDELERHHVMLAFKGDLDPDLITTILSLVERKLESVERDIRARKRVFNVVVECLQNLFHHRMNADDGPSTTTGDPHGVVMIAQSTGGYSVVTGNFIAGDEVEQLKAHLDRINTLGPEELREWHRAKLADGRYSNLGGGGLGMIDIARRSGEKLEYAFVPHDQDNSFFSLNVNVNT